MTERMGYWVDIDDAYRTMDPAYVESVWWSLKQIYDKGLLVEDYRVAPYCPRCGTGLSDHELAQGYETVTDPQRLRALPAHLRPARRHRPRCWSGRRRRGRWCPTPPSPRSPTSTYVVATDGDGDARRRRAAARAGARRGLDGRRTGSPARRWSAGPTSARSSWSSSRPSRRHAPHFVVLADYVTTEDGTGLVHQSPAFGEDDLRGLPAYGLPVVDPVQPDGHFEDDVPLVGGQFFKHADADLVAGPRRARACCSGTSAYEHSYPHCWRCHTALLYYAQPSWYVRTTAVKDALLRENEKTNWFPETIKHGRYGDWLNNNIDWALSRSRYWGTPLPIWRCDEGHQTCVGSLAELVRADRHRPVRARPAPAVRRRGHLRLPGRAAQTARRGCRRSSTPGTTRARCRSRSGATRTQPGSAELFEQAYPAQFICEAIDQTRGWFYTLMAVGTLVFDRVVVRERALPGPHPRRGRPQDVQAPRQHPRADPADGPARRRRGALVHGRRPARRGRPAGSGTPRIQEIVRKVLLTYWNTVAFQALYARTSGWSPRRPGARRSADRPVLDRWALSEAHRLAAGVTEALEAFDTQRAGQLLAAFVDDLSNWYVRRSRRRFWDGDPAALRRCTSACTSSPC